MYILDIIVPGRPGFSGAAVFFAERFLLTTNLFCVIVFPTVNVYRRERRCVMADATAAEFEKFKLERASERKFITELTVLVAELRARVSPKNQILRSMERFLKANV